MASGSEITTWVARHRKYNRSGDVQQFVHYDLTAARNLCEHAFGSAG
jgi:hypothetical protein